MRVTIEAQINGNGTFLQVFREVPGSRNAGNSMHMFIDTLKPEPVINAIEERLEAGLFWSLMQFMKKEGKAIRDPIELRLKLDSAIPTSSIPVGFDDEPVF